MKMIRLLVWSMILLFCLACIIMGTVQQNRILGLLKPLTADDDLMQQPRQEQRAFLVYCAQDKWNLSPVHMMSGFTNRTLDDPPPWNSTAFLVTSGNKECQQNEYYKEALRRHRESPFIQSEPVPPYNDSWVHGVKWPPYNKNETYPLRVVRDRPVLVRILGEVFWRYNYGSCRDVDMVVYRSKEVEWNDCLTIHYIQGVSHAYRLDAHDYAIEKSAPVWLGQNTRSPALPAPKNATEEDRFCGMVIGGRSGKLQLFKRNMYPMEALVRHAMFALLNESKSCIRPQPNECPGSEFDAFKCLAGFKFNINMENTQESGYVSEKVFNGILSGPSSAIPIYFGAPDVDNYINTRRIVVCNISKPVIDHMRSFYPRHDNGPQYRTTFTFNASNPNPSDEELLDWAKEFLRKPLEPCINRVKELDRDAQAFNAVLKEPFVTDLDILTGHDTLRGIDIAYGYLSGTPALLPRFDVS